MCKYVLCIVIKLQLVYNYSFIGKQNLITIFKTENFTINTCWPASSPTN